jgi:Ca2+-binding EF-hand superfamily protein
MTKEAFKDSLGILGLENCLVERIYILIDEDQDGKASFEDFLKYLYILINGTKLEQALWSFKMLSNQKKNIEY